MFLMTVVVINQGKFISLTLKNYQVFIVIASIY